jgi:hypothetical protein
MKVFVATIDTYYQAMAVASDMNEAKRLVCERALEYLTAVDAVDEGVTDTVERIEEYFGVAITEIEVGTARLV